jgi:hypothetical protein
MMKNLKIKSFAILSLFMISAFAGTVGNTKAEKYYIAPDDSVPDDLMEGLSQMFGMFREFGAEGELLGTVLEMMFENFETMNATQELDGVYVLNASVIKSEETGNFTYSEGNNWEHTPWSGYNLDDVTSYENEHPYFFVNETGTVEYNKTEGISITFIIWDNDATFISALDKLISTFQVFKALEGGNDDEALGDAIEAVISAVTYFLIHINDIITGDEVIILNTIAFTNYVADFDGNIDATWYVTEEGVKTNTILLDNVYTDYVDDYTVIAEYYGDEFMLYLLDDSNFITKNTQNYTTFSFDVIEIWLKEFQISIDVNEILESIENETPINTDVFQELKLEFYVFTHHFQNWYLFDDEKFDKDYNNTALQVQAEDAVGNGVPDVLFEQVGEYEGEPVHMITDAEVVDYLLFRGAEDWSFKEPVYDTDANSMEWGIRAERLGFRVIPMGMNDDEISLADAPVEYMDYMELGFSFEPTKNFDVETGDYFNAQGEKTMGSAKVKLVQKFGQWDLDGDDKPFTPHLKDTSLDLTTVYMSTIFHFKLFIDNKEIVSSSDTPTDGLLNESNYNSETHKINVGDIDQELPLAEIDIAGPNYNQTGFTNDDFQAKTTIIPTVYAEFEAQAGETYSKDDSSIGQISAVVNIEFSTLIYAVSYDTFGTGTFTSGDEIIHDPTFSVFITTVNPGVIAIILVIGAVGMAGIAAVMITKKKNAQF